jgi:hypothetical protein
LCYDDEDVVQSDGGWREQIVLEYHLSQYHGFFARIWHALKYVFGFRSRYGDWGTVLIGPKQAAELQKYFAEYIALGNRGQHERRQS